MPANIHPSAIIAPNARLAEGVEVGPCAVIDGDVALGRGTKVGPHAYLTGQVEIGEDNVIGASAVIGTEPQDLAYKGAKSFVRIGRGNVFREYVSIHRGTKEGTGTVIGDDNYLMASSHVGHNCRLGNRIIFANGVLLGGYVDVADNVFLSGHCVVHQFCKIGEGAMMRGGTALSLDLPPYCMVGETNRVRGLNTVGLERRGFTRRQLQSIKALYRDVFNNPKSLNLQEAVAELSAGERPPEERLFLEFIKSSERGVCRPLPG